MAHADGPADFDAAMAALGLADDPGPWRDGWAESQAAYPADGPEFLREGFVREACGRLGLPSDVCDGIVGLLAAFEARPALKRLAWHCHRVLFGRPAGNVEKLAQATLPWPFRPSELPGWGEAFHAPVLLSGGPYVTELHAARGIGMEVTRDTVSDLGLWMRHYRGRTGRWGLAEAGWLASHFLGRIFKLGRLQFRFEQFNHGYRAYRHVDSGQVLLLAQADPSAIRGVPITSTGLAFPEPVTLHADEWRPILSREDRVLGVHIPATGPMTHEACGQSFDRAVLFFDRHFPEFLYKAFHCGSWFLDRQFGQMLPESSNIRRFQEEVYLYPSPHPSDEQTFERVFGRRYENIDDAPRDTTLRRAIVQHVRAGGQFHGGVCLLFPEDLRWGERVYRR